MKYEIVEYANELNDLNLSSFTLIDKRIFFSILSQCKNQPAGKEIIMKKEDLTRLGIYPDRKRVTLRQFARDLGHVVGLCYSMYFHKLEETDEDIWIRNIRLFDQIDIKASKKSPEDLGKIELHFKIEKNAKEFLDTVLPFTSFPLPEFQSLRSVYSQDLFLHLKQFKNQGKYFVKNSDFKKYLNIPKGYRQCDIDRRILAEAIKELQQFFPNLRYIKVRDENDRRKIGRYEFYWDVPEKKNRTQLTIPKGGKLPPQEEIAYFREKENLTIMTVQEMMNILRDKSQQDTIKSWKAYLRGAARIKEEKSKKVKSTNEYPTWWNVQDDEVTPELMLEAMIVQKLVKEHISKQELIERYLEELIEECGLDREVVLRTIQEI